MPRSEGELAPRFYALSFLGLVLIAVVASTIVWGVPLAASMLVGGALLVLVGIGIFAFDRARTALLGGRSSSKMDRP